MVINPYAGIQREPCADILAEIHISCHLVLSDVHDILPLPPALPCDILVPGRAPEPVPVHPHSQTVAPEHPHTLVCRYAHHVVMRVETVIQRRLSGQNTVSVVDMMISPVVEHTQGSGRTLILVFHSQRGHSPGHTLIRICQRVRHSTGIGCVEMCDIDIGPDSPVRGKIIPQLGIASVLLESHIRTVSVSPVVRGAYDAGEALVVHPVGHFGLDCVPRAVARVDIGTHPVLLHPARDDIDHTAHGVGAVQHRGRPAQNLDPLRHQGLICIRYRMAEHTHVLRMPVDEHHHLSGTSAQSAHRYGSRSPARDSVPHDAA